MSSPAKKMTNRPVGKPAGELATAPLESKKIARLAYSYWVARGRPSGSPEQDWFRAVDELRRKKSAFEIAKERRRHSSRGRMSSRGRPRTG